MWRCLLHLPDFKIMKCVIIYFLFLFKESLSSLILYLYFCTNLLKESPPNCISLRPHKPGSSLLPASVSIWTKDLFLLCPGEPPPAWATTFPEQFCQWVLQEEQVAFLLGSLFWGPWRSFPERSYPGFSGSFAGKDSSREQLSVLHLTSCAEAQLYKFSSCHTSIWSSFDSGRGRRVFCRTFPPIHIVFGSGDLTQEAVSSHLQQGPYQSSVLFNRVGVDPDEDQKEEPSSHQASQRRRRIEYSDMRASVP